jgi:hypothetical protein
VVLEVYLADVERDDLRDAQRTVVEDLDQGDVAAPITWV